MALTVGASAFFEPARTATIPNITSDEELLPANALASATWSAMLAIGASIGGVVTAVAGRNVAFSINAASFFWSALFIALTRYDSKPAPAARPAGLLALVGIADLIEGIRYVRRNAHVAALMCVKAGWGLAGGVLLLLTIFGQRVFPVSGGAAAGFPACRRFSPDLCPGEALQDLQAYANCAGYGEDYHAHRDSPEDSKNVTILYYANPIWERDWGGNGPPRLP